MLARILQSLKEAGIDQIRVVTSGPGDGGSVGGSVAARLVSSIAEKFGRGCLSSKRCALGDGQSRRRRPPARAFRRNFDCERRSSLGLCKGFQGFYRARAIIRSGKALRRKPAGRCALRNSLRPRRVPGRKRQTGSRPLPGAAFAVGVFERRDAGDYGRIVLDKTGCIQEIQERCEQEKEPAKKSQDEKSAQGAGGASGAPRYRPGRNIPV